MLLRRRRVWHGRGGLGWRMRRIFFVWLRGRGEDMCSSRICSPPGDHHVRLATPGVESAGCQLPRGGGLELLGVPGNEDGKKKKGGWGGLFAGEGLRPTLYIHFPIPIWTRGHEMESQRDKPVVVSSPICRHVTPTPPRIPTTTIPRKWRHSRSRASQVVSRRGPDATACLSRIAGGRLFVASLAEENHVPGSPTRRGEKTRLLCSCSSRGCQRRSS
ncbi:hypothetical protein F5Y14DRAFT_299258 [Nemania sp. NC0429]|nr:hypothetical protein F5Y14DRAFT_299258 [Nemania sp. NC0429]